MAPLAEDLAPTPVKVDHSCPCGWESPWHSIESVCSNAAPHAELGWAGVRWEGG